MTMPAIAPLERVLLELGVGVEVGVARLEEEDGDKDVAYKVKHISPTQALISFSFLFFFCSSKPRNINLHLKKQK